MLAGLDEQGVVRLWSLPDGWALGGLEGEPVDVTALAAVHPDLRRGARVATLQLSDGHPLGPGFLSRGVGRLAISSDGSLLAGTTDGYHLDRGWPDNYMESTPALSVFSLADDRQVLTRTMDEVKGDFLFVDFSLAFESTSADRPEPAGFVLKEPACTERHKLWSLPDGRRLITPQCLMQPIAAVIVTPDGPLAASETHDHCLQFWALPGGRSLATLEGHTQAIRAMAASPDGSVMVSAADDRTIRVVAARRPLLGCHRR